MRVINYGGFNWVVIDERNGKTIIITQDIIEKLPYNADRFCFSWAESTLRAHLIDTQFLLSVEEGNRDFPNKVERIANYQGSPRVWWLRDIGIKSHAAFVGKDGEISTHGYRVDCAWCGVRPAMWVKL